MEFTHKFIHIQFSLRPQKWAEGRLIQIKLNPVSFNALCTLQIRHKLFAQKPPGEAGLPSSTVPNDVDSGSVAGAGAVRTGVHQCLQKKIILCGNKTIFSETSNEMCAFWSCIRKAMRYVSGICGTCLLQLGVAQILLFEIKIVSVVWPFQALCASNYHLAKAKTRRKLVPFSGSISCT